MKYRLIIGLLAAVFLTSGCRDREEEIRRAKEDADAKAHAEAARKEMETLPKAFKSRQFNKVNEPEKMPAPAAELKKP